MEIFGLNIFDLVSNPVSILILTPIIVYAGLNIFDTIWLLVDKMMLGIDLIFNKIPIPILRSWAEDAIIKKIDKRIAQYKALKNKIKK